MANLGTFTINTNGEFATLASETELTFTADTIYTIQILQNAAFLREGSVGDGFKITSPAPIQYKAGSDDLYIRTGSAGCIVNIAD